MAFETQSVTIGESQFEITQLGAVKGKRVLNRLMKVLAGASSGMLGGKDGGEPDVVAIIEGAVEGLDDDTLDYICQSFGEKTTIVSGNKRQTLVANGNEAGFDLVFAGNYAAMIEWLIVCIRLNYSDFLDGDKLKSLGERLAT